MLHIERGINDFNQQTKNQSGPVMSNNFDKNYLRNTNSALFSIEDDDDIDDETFLKNSRKPNTDRTSTVAQLKERRDAVEQRTLASTERSLSLLRESEKVGIQTATELASQREQLERSSRNLDAINATLRTTQRNIDGIKSVFSSLKNYLTGPKENKDGGAIASKSVTPQSSTSQPAITEPIIRSPSLQSPQIERPPPRNAQEAIDSNLDMMAGNISQLRGLALNLGDEILEQNELLDSMQYKADKAEVTMGRQNLQMNRLLGKK